MSSKPLYLKPRGAAALVPWEEIAVDAPEVTGQTLLEDAQFVALDIETTGNAPFLVLEIGAERFRLSGPLSFFDTLVDCRAPINPYARKRHHIDRSMLIGAPEFKDARRAFLRFALGAVLVEHSHDAFDTWLVGRGLESPLEHPIIDTTALARLVLDLPKGQTPGLARLVTELGLDVTPAHPRLHVRLLQRRPRGAEDRLDVVGRARPAHLAAHQPEVGKLQLHVDGPRPNPVGLQSFGDSIREVAQGALELAAIADVVLESGLGRDCLGRPASVNGRAIAPLGESLEDGAVGANGLNQALSLISRDRAHVAQ